MRFKKIASVLASAVMLSSIVGFGAATVYPQPFVSSGGTADVAIVYGSHPAALNDLAAAVNVQDSLSTFVVSSGGSSGETSADCEGETCVKLDKSSNHMNLGDTLATPLGSTINDEDMATFLADGTYTADDSDTFDYEQKLSIGSVMFNHFQDDAYEDEVGASESTPTLGFNMSDDTLVFNYTLDFVDLPESDVSGTDLQDFEGTDMTLLGKNYYVSDAKNNSGSGTTYFGKWTLLDAANSALVSEGETVTVTVEDTIYEVSAQMFSSTEVILTINGERSNTMNEGETQRLSGTDTYVGVKDILYVSKDTGVSSVEFSIGNGKIEITSGANIEINDDQVDGVVGYIVKGTAASGVEKLDSIVIEWKTDDDQFITEESSLTLPGLESAVFSMAGFVRPEEEKITVQGDGTTESLMKIPVVDGTHSLHLLYSNATGEFQGIGETATKRLATTNESTLTFWEKKGSNNYHEQFVVSYAANDEAQSYVLSFSVTEDLTAGRNETSIKNEVTGETLVTGKTTSDDFDIGDVTFDIDAIGRNTTDRWVTISASNANIGFQTIYTVGGLKIYLPYEVTATGGTNLTDGDTSQGAISFTGVAGTSSAGHSEDTFYVYMDGEDEDDTLGGGTQFYLTLNENTDNELQVSQVEGSSTYGHEIEDSNTYESYIVDNVAPRVLHYTDPDRHYVEVMYPRGESEPFESESYAEVFISGSDSFVSNGGSSGVGVPVTDAEASSYAGKNLVVIGGSCVNTVAAELIGSDTPLCGDDWTAVTGVGMNQYLIQTFARTGSNVATLIAGYNMGDTANAANALTTTEDLDTSAGAKYTGSTVEDIEPVLDAA